jgi:hypothetical protein
VWTVGFDDIEPKNDLMFFVCAPDVIDSFCQNLVYRESLCKSFAPVENHSIDVLRPPILAVGPVTDVVAQVGDSRVTPGCDVADIKQQHDLDFFSG